MMKDVSILTNNGVNVEKSLELFGDMETYNDTLGDFLTAAEEKRTKLKEYKEAANMADYAIYVHSLKSDAKYFGFEKLADLAYQHEMQSKANNSDFVYENYNDLMTELDRIVGVVNIYMGKSDAMPLPQESKSTLEVKDKSILVVDDSNIIRNFVQKLFNNEYTVLESADGREAINIVSTAADGKISAMLLDLNMPNVNGFEVLEYFKSHNLFAKIPVSIITGADSKETIDEAFKYDIVDVLVKPFNERDVKRVLDKSIAFKESMN